MSDYIKRENAKRAVWGCTRDTGIDEAPFEYAEGLLEDVPAEDVAPVRYEEDGTLWVTVEDCEKVGRVIVKNEQGHFCRVFYMGDDDEETERHGRWIFDQDDMSLTCSDCGVKYNIDDADGGLDFMENAKYCLSCGCKMDYDEWLASKDR